MNKAMCNIMNASYNSHTKKTCKAVSGNGTDNLCNKKMSFSFSSLHLALEAADEFESSFDCSEDEYYVF